MDRRVYYYHRRFEPAYFRGKGWRGLVVRLLNWFRWKFELWCTYHAMILLARQHMTSIANKGEERAALQALKRTWNEDVGGPTSGPRSVLRAFGVEPSPGQHRYAEGRKNGAWPSDPQKSVDNLARSLANGQRKQAYTHSRDTLLVQEVEAEPVK